MRDVAYLEAMSHRSVADVVKEHDSMPDERIVRLITTLAGLFALLTLAAADVTAQRTDRSFRAVLSVVPLTGPPGTQISVSSQNLPYTAQVQIAVGRLRAGFETVGQAARGELGEISTSVQIPADAIWDRPLYVVALNDMFMPIGTSDPFHVTDANGMIRRRGRVTDEGGSCLTLRDQDDLLYSLTGELGTLRPGDEVVVDGTYAGASSCRDGSTIGVTRTVARESAR